MKKYLIHCTSIAGHHMEYLHHLYMGALERPGDEYYFMLPSIFHKKKSLYDWPEASNIKIEDLEGIDENVDGKGLIIKSYIKSRNLNRYIQKYKVTNVILIDLMSYLPALPIIIPGKISVSGILYRIYLYEWKDSGLFKRIQDVLKYVIFSKNRVFERVYILNDAAAATYLNKLYKTKKFSYLPDPVASFENYIVKDVRKELNIDVRKKLYLHPGGMLPYKGTLDILRAIDSLDNNTLSRISVIFAGRITPYIREEFFSLYNKIKDRVQVILIEGFLSFEDLADLFFSCDYVLIPYKVKGQSSGIVGHAAFYDKPVIVAKEGVIGKVVKKYHLGPLLELPTANNISIFMRNPQPFISDGQAYVLSHTVENFNEIMYQKCINNKVKDNYE